MKLGDLAKVWMTLEALDDQLDEAGPGDEIQVPKIKSLKINGKRYTLKDAVLVQED